MPDSARIVVGHLSADVAEGVLTRSSLANTTVFDMVAASYLEVGKLDDALAMNRLAADSDRKLDDAVKCHRLVRAIAATSGEEQDVVVGELHQLATPALTRDQLIHPRDPTCIALDNDVTCWRTPSECLRAVAGNGQLEALLLAYSHWPRRVASFDEWRQIVDDAGAAMPGDEAFALLSRALELAIGTTRCDHKLLGGIERKLGELRTLDGPTSPYDARLAALHDRVQQLDGVPFANCAEELDRR